MQSRSGKFNPLGACAGGFAQRDEAGFINSSAKLRQGFNPCRDILERLSGGFVAPTAVSGWLENAIGPIEKRSLAINSLQESGLRGC